jgi:branched-chain amino acid transport system permease protein
MMQIIVQGLLLSGLYALIAMGFMLIFSIGRTLNLAYGAYIMVGGYMYFWLSQQLGMPQVIGFLGAIFAGAFIGLLKHRLIVKPLKGDAVAVEIATLILAIATVMSWIIILALYAFVRGTHTGRAMQAVSMDEKGAAISGIDPDRINMITWGISGALGAAGGVFFASYTQLSPQMWLAPVIISVAIVIVGGIGSIIGTLIVAHIIGFLEITVVAVLAPELRGVFTMVLIIGVLIIRPQGLFGREEH